MTGKEKCSILKQLRRELAEANGIIYLTAECTQQEECSGTCPLCEAEIRYLDAELNRLAAEGIPITIAGLCSTKLSELLDTYTAGISDPSAATNTDENEPIVFEHKCYYIKERVLEMTLEELELSKRTFVCLDREGVKNVEDIIHFTIEDLMKIRGFSQRCMDELVEKMRTLGLAIRHED